MTTRYGQFTPSLIASANADLSDNDLRNIANAAEGFTVTGVLTRRGIEVPRFNSVDPIWAATAATVVGATNMIAAPDGLGSSIANLNGGGALPTSIALVWIKNTGNQLMWVYYCAADQMTVEPLASSATDYFALGVGKSALIYVRVLQQYLFHNAAFAGFLGLSGGWSGLAADPASTADIVVLGLDSYWSSVDYT